MWRMSPSLPCAPGSRMGGPSDVLAREKLQDLFALLHFLLLQHRVWNANRRFVKSYYFSHFIGQLLLLPFQVDDGCFLSSHTSPVRSQVWVHLTAPSLGQGAGAQHFVVSLRYLQNQPRTSSSSSSSFISQSTQITSSWRGPDLCQPLLRLHLKSGRVFVNRM